MPANRLYSARKTLLWLAALLLLLAGFVIWFLLKRAQPDQPGNSPETAASMSASGMVKIHIDREGMYTFSPGELRSLGINPERLEGGDLHLSWRGQAMPAWSEKSAAGIQYMFYAPAPSSPYSQEDIYWLSWGGGAPGWLDTPSPQAETLMQMVRDSQTAPAINSAQDNSAILELVLEEQAIYFPQVESGDRFLWKTMPAPTAEEFTVMLEHLNTPGSESAFLQIQVWASTEARVEPDHAMNVLVNGELAASQTWDGRGRQTITVEFPAAYLRAGENTIQLELPAIPDVAANLVNLDRIVLFYPGRLDPDQSQQSFWGTGGRLELDGAAENITAYDISNPFNPTAAVLQPGANGKMILLTQAGKRYLVLNQDGGYTPAQIEKPLRALDLRDPSLAADYVAIGPRDLLDALKPLMDLREEQGISTLMVEDQQVYDQFGYGYPEPDAVQAFLRHAHQEWLDSGSGVELRFLLLVGDATYDPRRYLSTEQANRMPTYLVDTVFGGQTATDVDFVQFNDDLWPDLAVGRLPAQTAQQINDYVAKVLIYEQDLAQNPAGLSIQAVADGQEASFSQDAQEFLNQFPESVQTDLYSPAAGAEAANARVREFFQEGSTIVAYFGHGSVNMWGKDRLFTVEDVAALESQEQFPIVLNLTCLTGLFTHPKAESLAEALLWKAGAGAVAVLAPSSLTLPFDQTFLSHPLAEAFGVEQGSTIGEMHLSARRQIPVDSQGSLDVMRTFMLFGDPAITLK